MTELTNVGSLLINEALPPELRQDQHDLNKKSLHKMFMTLAEKYPDQYKDIFHKLSDVGRTAAWTEGASISLGALRKSQARDKILEGAKAKVKEYLNDDSLSDSDRNDKIVNHLLPLVEKVQKAVFSEAEAENNPYAMQLKSGARGKQGDLSTIKGADLLSTDARDRFIPVPLWKSYAEGYTPAQYFAASFSQRKGALGVKMAVGDAGYLTKRVSNAAHRITVSKDRPDATRLPVGLPVSTDDNDNIGAVLAKDAGKYREGTVIDHNVLSSLRDDKVDDILVHSTLTEPTEDGGVSALAAGRRTRSGLAQIGDNIGLQSAQAIGERLSQGSLGSKHNVGAKAKASRSGIEYLNRLLDAPETFAEAGPLAHEDGAIQDIRRAPQGGHYVKLKDVEHYVPPGLAVTVNKGDHVEQGDDLTDGVPHPSQLVKYRGLGEARKVFTQYMREALQDSGASANRRNIEPVVGGLMNWVKVTNPDGYGDHVYGDTVPFNRLAYHYKPRESAKLLAPNQAVGKYLEEPALHYTIGTRINKKNAAELSKWGIKDIYAHDEAPDFEPQQVRSALSVYHDPDWRTRLVGFYTGQAFQNALHRGATSDASSTSYVPAVTKSNFGDPLETMGKYGEYEDYEDYDDLDQR